MADASGNAAASSCKLVDRHSAIRNPPPAEDEIDWCGRGGGGRGGGTVNSAVQCAVCTLIVGCELATQAMHNKDSWLWWWGGLWDKGGTHHPN